MNYIKKLTLELDTGEEIVVDGLAVNSIEYTYPITSSPRYGMDFIKSVGPMEVIIKLTAWGNAWAHARARSQQQQEYIAPPLKRLPSAIKQLPEHKDE